MSDDVIYSAGPEDFYYISVNIPCQEACPVNTNIPSYIRSLYEEKYNQSYETNRLVNIFPGVLGRICSRPCENKCRHGESELGKPVNICHIKRGAADFRGNEVVTKAPVFPSTGKKVAVIGSGPAGLAAAHDLSTIGISVTIYEALDRSGGMLAYGIPEFRLPRNILDKEIEAVLELGVALKTGVRIGSDITIENLMAQYDGVLVAVGCYSSIPLNVNGEALPGVHSGLKFMMDVCSGRMPKIGKKVLVIGAGFTAFDCARSALRLGAEDVTICLRRTEKDLTVTQDEILEAKREGIKFNSLLLSRGIIGKEKAEGIEFVRSRPGMLRPDGKRKISPIEGSNFIMSADSIIVAVGQRQESMDSPGEKDDHGILIADRKSFCASASGLYVAGDYLSGASTVIEAIASGRQAAERIARDLLKKKFREKTIRVQESTITDRKRIWDFIPRQEMPTLKPMRERFQTFNKEVETGHLPDAAKEESKRCYLCYYHFEIDISRCIYCRLCIDVAPRDCIKMVEEIETNKDGAITGLVETTDWEKVNGIVIDNSRCIRCGECMRVCPVDCISVSKVELLEELQEKERCNSHG